jgi:uncharacterized membrane protein
MPPDKRAPDNSGLSTQRLEAFSDGVFAIVITLLVLEIHVPQIARDRVDVELFHHLLQMWPKFLSFAVSFVIVGIFWVGHHNIFHLIRRTDRPLLWINLLFLLCVAFIPFPTALMGEYVGVPAAVVPYGLTLIATGLSLYLLWWYATHRHRLVSADLDPEIVRLITRRTLAGPAFYVAAILLSLVNARLTLLIYALIPLYFILPHRLDVHLERQLSPRPKRS